MQIIETLFWFYYALNNRRYDKRRQTINSIESGKYVPSTILALKIARYFGKNAEDIFKLDEGD